MPSWTLILILSIVSGTCGTLIGTLLAVIFGKANDKAFAAATSISAGVMLSLVFFDLLPEAWEAAEGLKNSTLTIILAFAIGLVFMFGISIIVDRTEEIGSKHHHESCDCEVSEEPHAHCHSHSHGGQSIYTIALAIALHNLPAGLLIGAPGSPRQAVVIALVLMLHNLPEGFALALPIYRKTKKVGFTILVAVLVSLPIVIGAMIGYFVTAISNTMLAAGLAFAAGSMFSVVHTEMYPAIYEKRSFVNTALIAISMFVSFVCLTLIEI